MAFAYTLPIRIVQAVLSIIVLGLMAYGMSTFLSHVFSFIITNIFVAAADWSYWWSPDSVNFLVFTSVWSLLALIYLIVTPTHFPRLAHKWIIVAVEALTMLFWFAGFIALAVMLNNLDAGHSHWGVLRASIAGDVFAAFLWYVFLD